MRWIVAIVGIWIAVIVSISTFFVEWRYDCHSGSTSCTKQKLLFWRK